MTLRILQEDEELDPILSVVNLVDVFLVMIGALMMIIAVNPLNPFAAEQAAGAKPAVIEDGNKIDSYISTSQIGSGEGTRAGIAYRLKDGSFIYVPDAPAAMSKDGPSGLLRQTRPSLPSNPK